MIHFFLLHIKRKKTNNNNMIYFIGLLVGLLNGLFASGAGQILVVYLIFFRKEGTHTTRAVSVTVLSIASIFAIFGYGSIVKYDWIKVGVIAIIAAISGFIGSRLMKKIPANILNLSSGILIVVLTFYKIFFGSN